MNCRNFDKLVIAWIWTICHLFSVQAQADEKLEEVKIPPALSAGLDHFLDLADPVKTVAFDPKKVAGILDFINQPGKRAALYYADSVLGAPSAYYEFDIHEHFTKEIYWGWRERREIGFEAIQRQKFPGADVERRNGIGPGGRI